MSEAVYSHHIFLVVKTTAYKIRFKEKVRVKACQLYATFSDKDNREMIEIYPESYSEGIEYLMGRRVLKRLENSLRSCK